MKILSRSLILFFILGCSTTPQKPVEQLATSTPPSTVPPYLTEIRQLTFQGARAGESYFSHDGRYMIFQSEREKENPFYQIYLMDMQTGATKRISPGQGKTTCSWISPDNKHILFASTHADPDLKKKIAEELDLRKNPKGKYSWSFDDAFEIYETDFNGKTYKNLTKSPGYDAEGSYSPDGKWIAFASNRAAYTGKMTDEQRKLFERDPSTMMDIYIMRADGSNVKQLTTEPGYDGGPFFSPDGKRLTFRHFAVDGQTAEVFTMNVDGSDKKQITHLKAMSWAPFYHPSGDYLIFTTNKQGYANFELYIVDVDGKHEPVRVTDLPGFDGLPVFTPDGKGLVWSHTNERGEAQIFRAEWNDLLARQALKLEAEGPQIHLMSSLIDAKDARTWVEYLASRRLQGRPTGTPQEQEYLLTIAKAFSDIGLKPLGKDLLQKYEFTSGIELDPLKPSLLTMRLAGKTENLPTASDWIPLSYSKTGHFDSAPLIFAGYGIVAPAAGNQPTYDSYSELDVKDKWVVVFSGLPDEITNERRFFLHTYSRLQHKAMMARTRGARGLVVVEDTATPSPDMQLKFEGRGEDAGIPVVRLSPQVAERLFSSSQTSRKEWTGKLSHGDIATLAFTNATVESAEVNLKLKTSVAHNALGILQVPGATSTLVIGAHGDHLGHGEMGNSLWRGTPGAIHFGADDNASGVAGVMEIAHDLAAKLKSKSVVLKQNILFAVWTGEEIGILGSNQFFNANNTLKISGYLNLDMIGRYRDQIFVQGLGSAPEWKGLVERAGLSTALVMHTQDDPYLPSDALTFYMKQIPVLMFFTGSHPEYHTPKDTPDLINYQGLAQTASLVEKMAVTLASSRTPLVTYRKVEGTQKAREGRGLRLYLGTVPDYSQDGKKGVVITGTSKDSPAEKAGIKPGDMIIELGGMKVQNLYDYVYCLQALKANVRTRMRVMRGGEEKELEITPVLKTQ